MKIKTRQELEAKRAEYAASLKTQKKQILICAGTGCGRRFFEHLCKTAGDFKRTTASNVLLVLEKESHEECGTEKEDAMVSVKWDHC